MISYLSTITLMLLLILNFAAAQGDDLSLAVSAINQARQGQRLSPLTWNDDLASYAAFWAQQMASGAVEFGHAPGQYRPSQGETLYEEESTRCDQAYDNPIQAGTRSWLAEAHQWTGQPVSTGTEPWLHWCKS